MIELNIDQKQCHSIKCILVGNGSKSDGQLFYVPHTRNILRSADYELDPTHPSGPMFQLNYNGCIQFNLHLPDSDDIEPPAFTIKHKVAIIEINNDKNVATIIDILLNNSIFYTIKHQNDDTLHQVLQDHINNLNQSNLITTSNNHIHDKFPWLKNDTKIKLFSPNDMKTSKQGYLSQNDDDTWYFKPGRKRKSTNKIIPLPDLHKKQNF